MRIIIKFRGPIARQFQEGTLEMTIDQNLTIMDLFTELLRQSPNLQSIWNNPSEIDRDSMILRNEVDIGVMGGLSSILNDGDILTILPLVHGG